MLVVLVENRNAGWVVIRSVQEAVLSPSILESKDRREMQDYVSTSSCYEWLTQNLGVRGIQ